MPVIVSAPGRVNLIGDHTDYTQGLVLPMVLDVATTITGDFTDDRSWHLVSDDEPLPVVLALPIERPDLVEPRWGRYVAGVLHELERAGRTVRGFSGRVSTTIPIGSGLSSSAALEIAVARVATADDSMSDTEMALLCQRAEHLASGVPCGIMDQLCIASGRAGHATLIDCRDLTIEHVSIPSAVAVDVEFVAPRTLAGSEYADRVAETAAVERIIGPLRDASPESLASIADDTLRRRARHVISENQRVRDFVAALGAKDWVEAGRLMTESHRSLSRDFETSNATMDAAVERTLRRPGVLGARMTGGGFGGCVVALSSVE
ncbi:MAG: galactokinase [Acidimicrobiales bacterium mtb01]|nr:galactokinase [Actinomycetota bacterium]TEX45585.1 MAG: galactokinase [Acidimicrobiales bacterium mtb01]